MSSRSLAAVCLALALLLLSLSDQPASAALHALTRPMQPRQNQPQQKPQNQKNQDFSDPVTFDGVIKSVKPKEIEVAIDPPSKDKGNKPAGNAPHGKWTVTTQTSTKLHVTGEAAPAFLRPGQMVRFVCELERHEVKGKVKDLTVLTTHGTLHLASDASKKSAKDLDDDDELEAEANAGSGAAKGNPKDAKGAAKDVKDAKSHDLAPDTTTLTGRLDMFRDHKWSVHVAGKAMQIELANDAKIKVALSNGKLISVGDKVSVQGKMVHGKSGKCLADELKITLVKPLTAASFKPKSSSPAVKKPDVDDDDDATKPDADSVPPKTVK